MENADASFEETGVTLASTRLLARSDSAAVVLHALTAYTAGLVADIRIHWRGPAAGPDVLRDDSDGGLRLGFGYRGSVGVEMVPPGRGIPAGPRHPHWRVAGSDGKSAGRCDAAFVLAPYPDAGGLVINVAWPSREIETVSSRVVLPPRIRIHAKSERLWPGRPTAPD